MAESTDCASSRRQTQSWSFRRSKTFNTVRHVLLHWIKNKKWSNYCPDIMQFCFLLSSFWSKYLSFCLQNGTSSNVGLTEAISLTCCCWNYLFGYSWNVYSSKHGEAAKESSSQLERSSRWNHLNRTEGDRIPLLQFNVQNPVVELSVLCLWEHQRCTHQLPPQL